MDIAILFGDKSTAVVNAIKQTEDSLDLKAFKDIDTFINFIRQSNLDCSRILINTNSLNNEYDIKKLYDFLRVDLPSTSVVFLVSATDTSNIQAPFSEIFNLSIYTDVTAEQTNLPFLINCIKSSITELRDEYSAIEQSEETEDQVLAESYEESLDEEITPQEQLIAEVYDEPILSSDEPEPLKPKDIERKQNVMQTAQDNESFNSILSSFIEEQRKNGYLSPLHYPLNLADVDPSVLLFKTRLKQSSPREIKVNTLPLDVLRKTLTPIDILRLSYADTGVLNYSAFVDNIYTAQPLLELYMAQQPQQQGKKSKKKEKGKGLFGLFGGKNK